MKTIIAVALIVAASIATPALADRSFGQSSQGFPAHVGQTIELGK